jgi:MFS family permease
METQTAEGRPLEAIAAQDRPISRVRIAAAAFCMQLTFGAVYGWSVFLNPLREQFGAGKAETNLTFTITLAVIGVTAAFGGSLQRRIGPRATVTIAGLLYGCGVILSGFAPNLGASICPTGHRRHRAGLRLHRSARRLIAGFPTSAASSPGSRSRIRAGRARDRVRSHGA